MWELVILSFCSSSRSSTSSPGAHSGLSLFQLWDTERPDGNISLVHSSSMRQFNWGYTQFSQFNADDTLLLVSGVYLGPHHSSSGEIAVISLGRWRRPAEVERRCGCSMVLFNRLLSLGRQLHPAVPREEQAVRRFRLLAQRDPPDLREPALDRQHDVLLCAVAQQSLSGECLPRHRAQRLEQAKPLHTVSSAVTSPLFSVNNTLCTLCRRVQIDKCVSWWHCPVVINALPCHKCVMKHQIHNIKK